MSMYSMYIAAYSMKARCRLRRQSEGGCHGNRSLQIRRCVRVAAAAAAVGSGGGGIACAASNCRPTIVGRVFAAVMPVGAD